MATSKCAISHAATSKKKPNTPFRPAAPQKAYPNLWEVAAWEMEHLGSCPWEIAFGKEPKTDFTPHLNSDTWSRNLLNHIFILIILYRVTHKGSYRKYDLKLFCPENSLLMSYLGI